MDQIKEMLKIPEVSRHFFETAPDIMLQWIKDNSETLDSSNSEGQNLYTQRFVVDIADGFGVKITFEDAISSCDWLKGAVEKNTIEPEHLIIHSLNKMIYQIVSTQSSFQEFTISEIADNLAKIHKRIFSIIQSNDILSEDKEVRAASHFTGLMQEIKGKKNGHNKSDYQAIYTTITNGFYNEVSYTIVTVTM